MISIRVVERQEATESADFLQGKVVHRSQQQSDADDDEQEAGGHHGHYVHIFRIISLVSAPDPYVPLLNLVPDVSSFRE